MFLASSMAVGPAWERACPMVDLGSEHPLLISQSLADQMGLHGPLAARSGQLRPLGTICHCMMWAAVETPPWPQW